MLWQMVPIGGQVAISGDLTTPEIEYIVSQHTRYGLVPVDEIDRTKPFIGHCYSVDKPVPVEKIRRAIAHNLDVLAERGREIRKVAGVAAYNNISEHSAAPASLELSVIEDERRNAPSPEFGEALRVSSKFQDPHPGKRRRTA